MTRKAEEEESEEVAKPTLGRSGSGSKMASRSDRIVASLQALSDEKLQRLTPE